MSDVTDPRELHPEPVPTPDDTAAKIPPELAEPVSHGESSPVIEGGSPFVRQPDARRPSPGGRSGTRVLIALGFVLLFGTVAWEYLRENSFEEQLSALARGQTQGLARVDALEEALRAETAARTAIGHDVDALKVAPPRVTTTATLAPDLGPIEARLKALEEKPAPVSAPAPAPAPDAALLARVNSITDQLDDVGKKLAAAQTQAESAQVSAQAAQSRAAAALTRAAATVALDNGKPLGTIPHAPPALTRFATEAPPTEALLRLSYDDAAAKAQDASVPPTTGKTFGARMLTRIESLVTVSKGDHVLVGPPAATILASAHEKLQAGDLAGAIAALDGLDPAAAAAMAPWRDRAKTLLDARASLQSDQLGAP